MSTWYPSAGAEIQTPISKPLSEQKMTPFCIVEWNKSQTAFTFIGQRADRKAFFLINSDGQRLCLVPDLPLPPDAAFIMNPWPASVPEEIHPARLQPPPVRATQDCVRHKDPATVAFSAWELVYGEFLCPQDRDGGPLLKKLERYQEAAQQEYRERQAQLANQTRDNVKELLFPAGATEDFSEAQYQAYLAEQKRVLEILFTAPSNPASMSCGCLNWTLEMVKESNCGDIRNSFLREEWAKKHGFNLEQMEKDKARFLQFIKRHVANFRETNRGTFGLRLNWNDQEILCASVRFNLKFAGGSNLWLSGYELRPLLDAAEQNQFETCFGDLSPEAIRRAEAVSNGSAQLERCEMVIKKADSAAKALTAVADHLAKTTSLATGRVNEATRNLNAMLEREEALVESMALRENPRQTRIALNRHHLDPRIIDFIMDHLLVDKPVPKAPTAARMLQKKYSTQDGLSRKTVDRAFAVAAPILQAAGWSDRLLPKIAVTADKAESAEKTLAKPETERPEGRAEDGRPSEDSKPTFDTILQNETGDVDEV